MSVGQECEYLIPKDVPILVNNDGFGGLTQLVLPLSLDINFNLI